MKATGVVRRIDDLGRIVIPKEIRRNLKINDGDSLEIFVDNNGIVLKKYSLLDDMVENAIELVDVVFKVYGKNILITDKEKVIAASKEFNKSYYDKELSSTIKDKIDDRIEFLSKDNNMIIIGNVDDFSYFLVPILANSDSLGSVILIDHDISEEDKNLVRFITAILIKKVEE
jgi:AbrB family transcriptional regulator (stage V sporulation protein T)